MTIALSLVLCTVDPYPAGGRATAGAAVRDPIAGAAAGDIGVPAKPFLMAVAVASRRPPICW
jgi:hypothetical protein